MHSVRSQTVDPPDGLRLELGLGQTKYIYVHPQMSYATGALWLMREEVPAEAQRAIDKAKMKALGKDNVELADVNYFTRSGTAKRTNIENPPK